MKGAHLRPRTSKKMNREEWHPKITFNKVDKVEKIGKFNEKLNKLPKIEAKTISGTEKLKNLINPTTITLPTQIRETCER